MFCSIQYISMRYCIYMITIDIESLLVNGQILKFDFEILEYNTNIRFSTSYVEISAI